jgi:hypothetical protein
VNLPNRAWTRLGAGAVGLFAAGAFTAPALAATTDVDLGIEAAGGKIAATSSGKFSTISLVNHSKDTNAKGIVVTLDISGLDTNKVKFTDDACSPPEDGKIFCGIVGDVIKAGTDVDWLFPLQVVRGASGDAGQITVTIEHEGTDPRPENNTATLKVEIAKESGADLVVLAGDVEAQVEVDSKGELRFSGDLNPGETGALQYFVANFGDLPAGGLKITVKLPEGATFTEVEEGCVYADDNRSAVCTYENFRLIPADQDKSDEDEAYSAAAFYNLVTVGSDVDAPAKLTGGTVTVEPLKVGGDMGIQATTATTLPDNVVGISAADVDASDNTDSFSVVVAGASGGGGGGDGGLPVTGAQAGLIGGVGAAVVAAGVVLFLVARRRKVVLVTPEDEKSAK